MDSFLGKLLSSYFTADRVTLVIRVVLILGIGFPLLALIRRLTKRLVRDKLSLQSESLIQRSVYYIGLLIILMSVMNEMGFKLSALLGAAGVFGIAIGFASQTSISNIISGIFLISEKPFVIGDTIQIGQTMGEITSIDLLSIKLRTPDNRFVRVPNETMIKTEVTNNTRFDKRRVNTVFYLSYQDDLRGIIAILKETVSTLPLADKEREPLIQIDSFLEQGIKLNVGVWGKTADFIDLKNSLLLAVKERFETENVFFLKAPAVQLSGPGTNHYNKSEKAGTNEYETHN